MGQQERDRIRAFPLVVKEVDSNTIHLGAEVLERVEVFFLSGPIKLVLPIAAQLFQVFEICSVVPARTFDIIRPASTRQAISKIVQCGLLYVDPKRLNCHLVFAALTRVQPG